MYINTIFCYTHYRLSNIWGGIIETELIIIKLVKLNEKINYFSGFSCYSISWCRRKRGYTERASPRYYHSQLVQLFISLGIIPADKAVAAQAAVGLPTTGTVTTTTTSNNQPRITLVGTPTINQSQVSPSGYQASVTATFNVSIQAVGGDYVFANPASSAAYNNAFNFGIYENGVEVNPNVSSAVTSWSVPSSGVVTTGLASGEAFKLQQNNTVQIPVTYSIGTGNWSTGIYAVGLDSVNYRNTINLLTHITMSQLQVLRILRHQIYL